MTATRSRPVGLLTIAVFVAVNALTIDRDPPVWQDEVQDVEPSVNLLLSARLTSSANAYADHLIVPHAWPYFAAQAGWLKAFGISPYSARWFHAVVVGLAVFVFAGAVRRLRVLRHESSVHALTAALLFSAPMTAAYRSARYDVLGMLILGVALFAHSTPRRRWRTAVLIAAGAALPWAGVHLLPYAALLLLASLAVWRGTVVGECCAVVGGVILGSLLYLAALASVGALETMLALVAEQTYSFSSRLLVDSFTWDLSTAAAAVVLVSIVGVARYTSASASVRYGIWGLVLLAAVPVVMFLSGRYTRMYAWMALAPAAVCLFAAIDALAATVPQRRLLVAAAVAAIAIPGLPTTATVSAIEWPQRSYAPVAAFMQAHLAPSDIVYADFPAYYGVKLTAARSYFGRHRRAMTPAQRYEVTALVLSIATAAERAAAQNALREFGDGWTPVAQYAPGRSRVRSLLPTQRTSVYDLVVYRKGTAAGSAR